MPNSESQVTHKLSDIVNISGEEMNHINASMNWSTVENEIEDTGLVDDNGDFKDYVFTEEIEAVRALTNSLVDLGLLEGEQQSFFDCEDMTIVCLDCSQFADCKDALEKEN